MRGSFAVGMNFIVDHNSNITAVVAFTNLSVQWEMGFALLDRQAMTQTSRMCAMSCGAESRMICLSGGRSRPAASTLPNPPSRSALKQRVLQQCKA